MLLDRLKKGVKLYKKLTIFYKKKYLYFKNGAILKDV